MKNVNIYFIDNTLITLTDKMINNFPSLLKWLKDSSNLPFETEVDTNPIRILYKHSIKSVDIFE